MVWSFECQGIGIGSTCGKAALKFVPTMGVVDADGNIGEKRVWLCDTHYDELQEFWRNQLASEEKK